MLQKGSQNSMISTWSRLAEAEASPGTHRLCFMANNLYLLGGEHFMVKYSLNSNKWHQLSCPVPPRESFVLVALQQSFYVYGGRAGEYLLDDIWKYEAVKGWRLIREDNIGARYSAVGVSWTSWSKLLVMGGMTDSGWASDAHLLDVNSQTWQLVTLRGQRVLPCWGFTASSYMDRAIVFGGHNETATQSNIFQIRFSGLDAIADEIHADGPTPRCNHCAVVLDNRYLMVYGGNGATGELLSDEWLFELCKKQWFRLDNAGSLLGPRSNITVCRNNKQLYFFGGKGHGGDLFDLLKMEIFDPYGSPQPSHSTKLTDSLVRGLADCTSPFQAMGLIMDSAELVQCTYLHIKFIIQDELDRQFRRRFRIDYDGRTMPPSEFLRFCRMFTSGIQPFMESPFMDYHTCLKLGALGLGTLFLLVQKDSEFLKVALFSSGIRQFHEQLHYNYYIEHAGTDRFWEGSDRIEESQFELSKKAIHQFLSNNADQKSVISSKTGKAIHYLYVYNLRMVSKTEYEFKINQNDIICQQTKLLKASRKAGWKQSIDVSMRAFISHLHLAPSSFKISVNSNPVPDFCYLTTLRVAHEAKLIELITVRSMPGLPRVQIYRDVIGTKIWNGILVYRCNRLIFRLGLPIGTSIELIAESIDIKSQVFGVVQLDEGIDVNMLKTDVMRQNFRVFIERAITQVLPP